MSHTEARAAGIGRTILWGCVAVIVVVLWLLLPERMISPTDPRYLRMVHKPLLFELEGHYYDPHVTVAEMLNGRDRDEWRIRQVDGWYLRRDGTWVLAYTPFTKAFLRETPTNVIAYAALLDWENDGHWKKTGPGATELLFTKMISARTFHESMVTNQASLGKTANGHEFRGK